MCNIQRNIYDPFFGMCERIRTLNDDRLYCPIKFHMNVFACSVIFMEEMTDFTLSASLRN